MELLLKRIYSGESYTTGMLFIRNRETKEYELFCDTIEPPRRERQKTGIAVCIPAGRYPLVVTWSPKFQRWLPLVTHVEGRSGIRIHAGNTVRDTTGCILVGHATTRGTIVDSRRSLATLLRLLAKRPMGEAVRLTIEDAPECEDAPDCEAETEAEDMTSDC